MRTCVLFLIVAFFTMETGLSAKEYTELLGEDSLQYKWWYNGKGHGYSLFVESYKLGETYEKNGKTYTQVIFFRSFVDGGGALDIGKDQSSDWLWNPIEPIEAVIGIRESEGRIIVNREEYLKLLDKTSYWSWEGNADYLPYEQTEEGEIVLYDFTKDVGDKFQSVEGYEDIFVDSIGIIVTYDGVSRHVQRLSNGYEVIEGIGCINSPGMWLCYLNPASSPCIRGVLEGFYIDKGRSDDLSGLIYLGEDYEIYYSGIKSQYKKKNEADAPVYDLQGRRLTRQPAKGVYIQDGKKRVR